MKTTEEILATKEATAAKATAITATKEASASIIVANKAIEDLSVKLRIEEQLAASTLAPEEQLEIKIDNRRLLEKLYALIARN